MAKNDNEYGEAERVYPLDGAPKLRKKDIKEGLAVDLSSEPATTSTQTPDPNVDSVGDTISATDTDTATATNVTVSDNGSTAGTTRARNATSRSRSTAS